MEAPVKCSLCGSSVGRAELEAHLRRELDYLPWECRLCPGLRFASLPDAQAHFAGRFSPHPGLADAPAILERSQPDLQRRLEDAFDASLQGSSPDPSSTTSTAPPSAKRPRLCDQPAKRPLKSEPAPAAPPTSPSPDDPAPKALLKAAKAEEPPLGLVTRPSGAEAAEDGKVSCRECGSRQTRANFRHHALRAHCDAVPFHCQLCPYKARELHHVRRHLRLSHQLEGPAAAAPEAYTSLLPSLRAEVDAAVRRCFGTEPTGPPPRLLCRCGASVARSEARSHVAKAHLKRPFRQCLLCPWESFAWAAAPARRHLAKAHAALHLPQAQLMEDRTQGLRTVADSLVVELFHPARPHDSAKPTATRGHDDGAKQ